MLTETGGASMFLKAVATDDDLARAFVSKMGGSTIDWDALRDTLGYPAPSLVPLVSITKTPCANCATRSIMLVNPGEHAHILHLHMVREPNRYGQWKIYGVERE
jgi:hypothetical protein